MGSQGNPFRSERLSYREYSDPEDNNFFHALQSDPIPLANSCRSLPKPQDRSFTDKIRDHLLQNALLFVIICKPAPPSPASPSRDVKSPETFLMDESGEEMSSLEPIGMLFLTRADPDRAHHRCSELGMDIKREFQGRGYGTETVQWTLDWAFRSAGLHRVELSVLGWNEGAKRLYERIGFREEGRKRESLWKDGGWWDEVQMGMLAMEWELIRQRSPVTNIVQGRM